MGCGLVAVGVTEVAAVEEDTTGADTAATDCVAIGTVAAAMSAVGVVATELSAVVTVVVLVAGEVDRVSLGGRLFVVSLSIAST